MRPLSTLPGAARNKCEVKKNEISAHVIGSKGTSLLSERNDGLRLTGPEKWVYTGRHKNMYQVEHDLLFASIRSGKPMNNGQYMCKSTLLAIMGRMATYTGQQITWEQALGSKEELKPQAYAWDAAPPQWPLAVPGQTKFV